MRSLFVFLGSLNGFLAVALGAFGAHALKSRLSPELLEVFHTGVQYHMTHALALLAVGIAARWVPESLFLKTAGWSFMAGIVLFSGSLYLLGLTGNRSLGMVTPFGGLAFLAGWLCFAIAALKA
jgi:uncharacterized membrane protein YgdD (TMEM256/DUF423 family)